MGKEAAIGFLLSIPIGVVTGLYSGIIVSRYSRFAELRDQLLRLIARIEYVDVNGNLEVKNHDVTDGVVFIVGDLVFLKHKKAGDVVSCLNNDMMTMKARVEFGRVDFNTYKDAIHNWHKLAREISPNILALLSFCPRL